MRGEAYGEKFTDTHGHMPKGENPGLARTSIFIFLVLSTSLTLSSCCSRER